MAISKEIINGLIKTIQNLYLSDDIPWMIGYSGGKDSTAALQLVWIAIEGLPERQRVKPIHIMNTDTLVESPVVSKWVEKSLDSMRKDAKEKNIDVMIWAVAESAIDLSWADADCILVAPQNAGDLEKVKGIVNSSIPVASIDGVNFSKMDGQAVLEQAIEMINK